MAKQNITFRNIPFSEALARKIQSKIVKLEQQFPKIHSTEVIVHAPHHHHHKGVLYQFSIRVHVTGKKIVVSDCRSGRRHENAYASLNDAFHNVTRRLEHWFQVKRGQTKHHQIPNHGRIVKIARQEGFGIIQTHDRQEVYFHRNSILNQNFSRLNIGNEVRFTPQTGYEGPQASSVYQQGKHHYLP